jgi:hypothetical protein
MYDAPGSSIQSILIDSDVVMKKKPAMYFSRGQRGLLDQKALEDDYALNGKSSSGHFSRVGGAGYDSGNAGHDVKELVEQTGQRKDPLPERISKEDKGGQQKRAVEAYRKISDIRL